MAIACWSEDDDERQFDPPPAQQPRLPRGSYVYPAGATRGMLGSGTGGGTVVNHYYLVDLGNAVVGRGAMGEIRRMIADGSAQVYSQKALTERIANR